MGQYEIGQKELIDIHHYMFMIDHCSLQHADSGLVSRVHGVNQLLLKHILVVSFLLNSEDRIQSNLSCLTFTFCVIDLV